MKKLILGLFLFGLTSQIFSQVEKIPEVVITAVNYKYLNAVETDNADNKVKLLEEAVALYDIKKSDIYNDEYRTYSVSFYIPDGKIVVAYDRNGKIIRTIEKFKNVKLPKAVQDAVTTRFPNWGLSKDVYHVIYHNTDAKVKKVYKVKLTNGEKTVKVKLDEKGNFID